MNNLGRAMCISPATIGNQEKKREYFADGNILRLNIQFNFRFFIRFCLVQLNRFRMDSGNANININNNNTTQQNRIGNVRNLNLAYSAFTRESSFIIVCERIPINVNDVK